MNAPRTYLHTIKRRKYTIIFFALACALGSFLYVKYSAPIFIGRTSLIVHRVNREKTADFQYDNYYSVQAVEYVTNTVASLLATPDILREIYQVSELDPARENLNQLERAFKARQVSSHLAQLTIKDKDAGRVAALSKAAKEVLGKKINHLELTYQDQPSFEIIFSETIIAPREISSGIAAGAGFLGGLFIGLGFVFLKDYLRKE